MTKIVLKLLSIIFYRLTGKIISHKIYGNSILNSFDVSDKVGIIIQGNIPKEKKFLLQILHNYRKLYPKVQIVLSTWVDSDKKVLREINKLNNVKVILNNYPKYRGIKNINLQILSTVNALKYLKNNNFKYALKTRTDQGIYQYNYNYIEKFIEIILSKSKLIYSTMNSFSDRHYSISDMLMFGNIEDLLVYWDCELDQKRIKDIKVEKNNRYFMRQGTAEGYLLLEFMKKIKYIPKWSNECSDFFVQKYFLSIDYKSLEQFWFKNDWYIEYSDRHKNIIRSIEFIG